jgi:hypothetical protein
MTNFRIREIGYKFLLKIEIKIKFVRLVKADLSGPGTTSMGIFTLRFHGLRTGKIVMEISCLPAQVGLFVWL